MTTIGGPGGIGGPAGPAPDGPSQITEPAGDPPVDAAGPAPPATDLDALAAELAAGRVSPREAIDRLLDRLVEDAGPGLDPAERAELRELFNDLIANDPHLRTLGNLTGRI
jgi:hypothetical protein